MQKQNIFETIDRHSWDGVSDTKWRDVGVCVDRFANELKRRTGLETSAVYTDHVFAMRVVKPAELLEKEL